MAIPCYPELTRQQQEEIVQVIQEWLTIKPEDRIMQTLVEQGLTRLRHEQILVYMDVVKDWLSRSGFEYQRYGLWALYYLATDPDYRNLPEILYLLTPFLRSIQQELRPDILNIFQNLAHYAPQETAYLLKQNLNRSDASGVAWLTRQLIQEFPQPIQDNLRESLRAI